MIYFLCCIYSACLKLIFWFRHVHCHGIWTSTMCKNICLKKAGFAFYFKVIYLFSYLINKTNAVSKEWAARQMLGSYRRLQEQHYVSSSVLRLFCFAEYSMKSTLIDQFYNWLTFGLCVGQWWTLLSCSKDSQNWTSWYPVWHNPHFEYKI